MANNYNALQKKYPHYTPAVARHLLGDELTGGKGPDSGEARPGYLGALDRLVDHSGFSQTQPGQFAIGAGDALKNMLTGAASLLPGVDIPESRSGKGTAYELGRGAGDIAGFLGGGEALEAARLGAKGIPLVRHAAQALEGTPLREALKRSIGTAGAGAIGDREDPLMGGVLGGLMGGSLEALPLSLRGMQRAAEFMHPTKYAQQLSQDITRKATQARNISGDLFNQAYREHAGEEFGGKRYRSKGEAFYDKYYTPKALDAHETFMESPTVENAHKLQSQLGYEARKIRGTDPESLKSKQHMEKARTSLLADMDDLLGTKGEGKSQIYKLGQRYHAKYVVPFEDSPLLRKISTTGHQEKDPKKLSRALADQVGKSTLMGKEKTPMEVTPQDHYLRHAEKGLRERLEKGQLGEAATATTLGLGVGGLPGALVAKLLSPGLLKTATNPQLEAVLRVGKGPYKAGGTFLKSQLLEGY